MIDKINSGRSPSASTGRIDIVRPLSKSNNPVSSSIKEAAGSLAGTVKHMAQQGAPIDNDHVHFIRNAIADGQYPVDAMLIADKMIVFDRSGTDVS